MDNKDKKFFDDPNFSKLEENIKNSSASPRKKAFIFLLAGLAKFFLDDKSGSDNNSKKEDAPDYYSGK